MRTKIGSWARGETKFTNSKIAEHSKFMTGNEYYRFRKNKTAWNKGLTKETDERVAKYAASLKGHPWHIRQLGRKQTENWHRAVSRNPSGLERLVQEDLVAHNIAFFANLHMSNCKPDIVIADMKIVVFCDGCYWHGCPIHFPGEYLINNRKLSISERRKKDSQDTSRLQSEGWTVLRFWEHEIRADKSIVSKSVETVSSSDTLLTIKRRDTS